MKELARIAGIAAAVGLVAVSGWAAFQASDLVYVPVAAHNTGVEGSKWRTDLFITNVDSAPVDVALFFLPSGGGDNSSYLATRDYALGGRSDQGFGIVDEALADIPAGGTVSLPDLVNEYWAPTLGETATRLGALVVFACDAGGFQEDGGCSTYRNVVVQSRTYNETTIWEPDPDNEGSYIQKDVTYGQLVPGVPWYNLADGGAVIDTGDFTYEVLVGAERTDNFRYNMGILNASDIQTTIYLRIEPFQPDGEPYTDSDGNPLSRLVSLAPLGQIQYNGILSSVFGLDNVTGVMLKVSFDPTQGWSTSSPDPRPMFTTYGSLIDSRTGDATTILPSFGFPYNVDCMWSGTGSGSGSGSSTILAGGPVPQTAKTAAGAGRRPFEMPPQ